MSLEERVTALENLLGVIISNMAETRSAISEGFKKTDGNFSEIHRKIDQLSGSANNSFSKVNLKLESIQEEISKINEATGYEGAFNNLKAIKGGT